jgi:hypothetical protein
MGATRKTGVCTAAGHRFDSEQERKKNWYQHPLLVAKSKRAPLDSSEFKTLDRENALQSQSANAPALSPRGQPHQGTTQRQPRKEKHTTSKTRVRVFVTSQQTGW